MRFYVIRYAFSFRNIYSYSYSYRCRARYREHDITRMTNGSHVSYTSKILRGSEKKIDKNRPLGDTSSVDIRVLDDR